MAKMLSDWARYKLEKGEPYPRTLYTNIPLYVEEVNDYLSREIGKEVDLSEQIVILEDDFFRDSKGEYRDWWEDFPEKSFQVIDEVHRQLPASVKRKKGGQDYSDKFMEYVSTHRHRQHDIILLTQHVDNVSVEVKKQIETIYEVLNVKSRTLGIWPFTIPMSDVDVVREAWGFPVQLAHIKRGICESRKVIYDKNYETFVLVPSLFKLYRSHTMSDEALDRPSLKLGKAGSIIWFLRRHLFRLGFWTIAAISCLFAFRNLVTELPGALIGSLVPPPTQSEVSAPSTSNVPTTTRLPNNLQESVIFLTDDKILGFVKNGVITERGILRAGDTMISAATEETIQRIFFSKSQITFKSGKTIKK
ncbi:hypothetical protein FACS1894189_8050 [Planctomycetales bacterium]|nr:hypothetical protein FACS1894189_8050 [Planctomycetales bacterium]